MSYAVKIKTKVLIIGAGTSGYMSGIRCGLLGRDAAVFAQRIKRLLEQPATLWVG